MIARDRRGVALMLVLWLIVILGTIAVSVAALVRGEATVSETLRTRAAARYAAESGIVAATARLTSLLRDAASPREQALVFRRLDRLLTDIEQERAGTMQFQVAVLDLNARIDVNNADEPTLLAFFGEFVPAASAERLVHALEDWKDADDDPLPGGAEAIDYERAGSPFRPPNRPLQRLDELSRIKGFSDSLVDAIAPYVTVQGDGRVNLNTAALPVLTAVMGGDRTAANALLEQRERGDVFTALTDVRRPSAAGDFSQATTTARRILFVSRGWVPSGELGEHPFTHEIQAVYDLDAVRFGQPRLTLRFWTERDR